MPLNHFLVNASKFINNRGSIYSLTNGVMNNTLISEDNGPVFKICNWPYSFQ